MSSDHPNNHSENSNAPAVDKTLELERVIHMLKQTIVAMRDSLEETRREHAQESLLLTQSKDTEIRHLQQTIQALRSELEGIAQQHRHELMEERDIFNAEKKHLHETITTLRAKLEENAARISSQ